jgi:hypothetical protein
VLIIHHALARWAVKTLCIDLRRLFTNVSFFLAMWTSEALILLLAKSVDDVWILWRAQSRRIIDLPLLVLISLDSTLYAC